MDNDSELCAKPIESTQTERKFFEFLNFPPKILDLSNELIESEMNSKKMFSLFIINIFGQNKRKLMMETQQNSFTNNRLQMNQYGKIYIYRGVCVCLYIYIYIYKQQRVDMGRERERERERERGELTNNGGRNLRVMIRYSPRVFPELKTLFSETLLRILLLFGAVYIGVAG